jgi:hypothetical protein
MESEHPVKRLFDYDPVTKTKTIFHASDDGETFHLETLQDVEDIVESNKASYAATDERARWGDIARVASIPMPLMYDLIRRQIIEPADRGYTGGKRFRKWLNDPENRHFKTRPGEV